MSLPDSSPSTIRTESFSDPPEKFLRFGICLSDGDFYTRPIFRLLLTGIRHSLINHAHDLLFTVRRRSAGSLTSTWHDLSGVIQLDYINDHHFRVKLTGVGEGSPTCIDFETPSLVSAQDRAAVTSLTTQVPVRQPFVEVGKMLGAELIKRCSG